MTSLIRVNLDAYPKQNRNPTATCDKVIVRKNNSIAPSRIYMQFDKNKGLVTQNYLFDARV